MTLFDLTAALRHEIRSLYPQVPVEAFEGGLLSPEALAYWLSTGEPVDQILRETMGRPRRVRES